MGFNQCRDKLVNLHESFCLEGYELVEVYISTPKGRTQYQPSTAPRKASFRISSCWKGFIANFELGPSGRVTLKKYIALDKLEQPVDEVLTGDFWLELEGHNPFGGSERIEIPFQAGFIVEDSSLWAGDPRLIAKIRMLAPLHQERPMAGSIKWFGGKNSQTGRINNFGFISSAGCDYYFHRSSSLCTEDSLVEGASVIFRLGLGRAGKLVAESVRVLALVSDEELVALIKAPERLSAHDTLTVGMHRSVLAPCENEMLAAIAIVGADSEDALKFWKKFSVMGLSDPSYGLAPDNIKRTVCTHHYSKFRTALAGLFEPLAKVQTTVSAQEIYRKLDECDNQIAKLWSNGSTFDATLAKMLSARAAEKAVKFLYEKSGSQVEDISIGQLDNASTDWVTHDLLVDGASAIDVKNARRPINGHNFYVEHTVPQFKFGRNGTDVVITGVLSPYRRLSEIRKPRQSWTTFQEDDLTFLGETRRADIDQLAAIFSSARLEVVRDRERTVPNWIFNYPANWYAEFSEGVRRLSEECEWPKDGEVKFTLDDKEQLASIPAYFLTGRPLPSDLVAQLSQQQVRFYTKLQRVMGCPPQLPVIFLAVLSDFLAQLKNRDRDYSPDAYLPLLFGSQTKVVSRRTADVAATQKYPLGAVDPLGLVRRLIETLTTLWGGPESAKLSRLTSFRFGGLGVLQGRESSEEGWTTLVAYCGGTVYATDERGEVSVSKVGEPLFVNGKCGQAPLILGRNNSCPSCGKLICGSCGFCSAVCQKKQFLERAKSSF